MKCRVILKSGVILEVTSKEKKNVIGLWVWSLKQATGQVLSFVEMSILSTEIAGIEELEGEF